MTSSYAKIKKKMVKQVMFLDPYFFNLIRLIQLCDKKYLTYSLTVEIILRTKSVTKKEMNKCMAEIYDPGAS